MDERTLMTVAQVVEALRVSRQRVYQMIGEGALDVVRLGRTVLVTRKSVERRRALRGGPDVPLAGGSRPASHGAVCSEAIEEE